MTPVIHDKENRCFKICSQEGETISALDYRYRGRHIHFLLIYTNKNHRNCGYGTQLMTEFVNEFGKNYDIKLECLPVEITIDRFYKEIQNKTAKFYEKFGFETTFKEDYGTMFQWEMTRFKK